MARANLRNASQLLTPAAETMIVSLDAPDGDAMLVALVRRQASVIDAMNNAEAVAMMPQHCGQLVKALAELEDRARRRRQAARPGKLNPIQQMRADVAAERRRKAG